VEGSVPARLVLDRPSTLEIDVKSTRGEPVPNASVWLVAAGACPFNLEVDVDSAGTAKVTDAPAGTYTATARAEGWANSDAREASVVAGSVTRVSLVMPDALRISGTVLTATGAAAVGARVKACHLMGSGVPSNANGVMGEQVAKVGPDGTFVLSGLSRATYALDAISADSHSLTELMFADAGTVGAVLRFPSR
jgi:hypothetical protein